MRKIPFCAKVDPTNFKEFLDFWGKIKRFMKKMEN